MLVSEELQQEPGSRPHAAQPPDFKAAVHCVIRDLYAMIAIASGIVTE